MPLQIGIFGRGRLGSAIAAAADQTNDLEVAWLVGHEATEHLSPVDVALDVSHADGVDDHLTWARATGTDLVIGATGWDPALLATSSRCQEVGTDAQHPAIGILTAPNFSLTVALLRRLTLTLGRYAAASPEHLDVAVSEVHHTRKVDAPSGTAVLLRDALAEATARPAHGIQTTSLRLGEVVGRHDVHLTGAHESITLTHEAHTRDVFALGALTAARWIHGRRGTFTFDDLADDVIDPLFSSTTT
ncbi:4-hydroxy-tetrahydrodipicolinate reductase [Ornithinimicrobium cryptoxanthini]|uniref:4-hydroxy-tetrahydrodipicolinate reductase n=1 Tax=Ornithinimicrobium cryptoxanthini TaxID=2934161 RepID=A0ABY4YKQ0_9MICO|nr:dihydrodipicolinate reductase C-terminal domain-containing protein [Ornithinimicrobium cryptoxanthini]USQ77362.1 hypothetical protein NF557_05465 [Ornithinimicrobium cryptoxanthini]